MLAIVREPHAALARCELTYLDRQAIDFPTVEREHRAYVEALRGAGCDVVVLPAIESLPDAVFVEDTAVALERCIALAAPGAVSRRPEVDAIAATFARYAEIVRPGEGVRLEGGDVMQTEDTVLVGVSSRTNADAVEYLREHTDKAVIGVEVGGCLHLKTGVTYLGDRTFVVNPAWIDPEALRAAVPDAHCLAVPSDQPFAANTLRIGEVLLVAEVVPEIERFAADRGLDVRVVPIPELRKAECGLTCMSVLLPSGSVD